MHRSERGQTTLDFVVGFGIFVVAVAFVFTASAGLLSPFAEHRVSDPLVADRTADHLTGGELVDHPGDAALNATATDAFFGGPDDDIAEDLGLGSGHRVNVTIERTDDGTIEKRRGAPHPDDSARVSVAQRIVVYDDETHWLRVRVW